MDDPTSRLSQLVSSEPTSVRKPEAGTNPKLFYIDADQASLTPTEQSHTGGYLWSELQMDAVMADEQALADSEARARTTYDVSHERPWGWKVSAYLWTKSISAGVFLMMAMAVGFAFVKSDRIFEFVAPLVSLLFLAITVGFLVWDLKRPERFLSILLRPQWKSWLVIGGYILVIFGGLVTAWLLIPAAGAFPAEGPVLVGGALFAVMSAMYSAFLFRQARGRVFWHSPLTPLHLVAQAMVAGAAMLMLVLVGDSIIAGTRPGGAGWAFLSYELLGALVANGVLIAGELFMPEENVERVRAVRLITQGIFRKMFWGGTVIIGVILPLLSLTSGVADYQIPAILTALSALAGLFIWEHVWVQAGQAVPLS